MKHIIILGDGMADHAIERLGGKTLLEYADTPYMDMLAKEGRCGRLITIPDGYLPGSEVANTAILGYDLDEVYEGRGPLEAASIGYEMQPDDMAMRCNIITLVDGLIKNHHGGHLTTEESDALIECLNKEIGNERIRFITGIQYRHLLIIRGGNKHITCAPPHDHPNEEWRALLVRPEDGYENDGAENVSDTDSEGEIKRLSPQETADLLNNLILRSQEILSNHPFNIARQEQGHSTANSIWPWSGGYRPKMQTLMERFPQIKQGSCISAVDLIRGIAHYAGLKNIILPGATGLPDTDYEGKALAAIEALKTDDFVFLHVEASDEAGHDGEVELKLQTIENLDKRLIKPIVVELSRWSEPVCIALLPDHPTPVELRTHVGEPVPFAIYHRGIEPDGVDKFDENSCISGAYGLLKLDEFMRELMKY